MEDVARQRYLQRRKDTGRFHYRRAVPPHLRAALGKGEFVSSLGTADASEAKRLYAEKHVEIERLIADLTAQTRRPGLVSVRAVTTRLVPSNAATSFIRMAAKDHLASLEATDQAALVEHFPTDVPEHLESVAIEASLHRSDPDWTLVQPIARRVLAETAFPISETTPEFWTLCAALNGAHIEHLKQHYYRISGEAAPFSHVPTGLEGRLETEEPIRKAGVGCTIRELIRRYETDPSRQHVRAKTKASATAPAKTLLMDVIGGDVELDDITRSQLITARQVLMDIPPGVTRRYPGKSLVEAARLNRENDGPRLSQKTVNNQLVWVTAMFNFAERELLVKANPARQLGIRTDPAKEDIRRAWTTSELRSLLDSPVFTDGKVDRSRFWVPLIALFQGLRLNEICQLYSDDVMSVEGIPCFRVASNSARGQATKTNTTRIVPINPRLLQLGILKLLHNSDAESPLFPELSSDKYGSVSAGLSKWFKRVTKARGFPDKEIVFHSFRHSFSDALRYAEVPPEKADALGGWTTGGGSSRRGYGSGYRPGDLLPEISKVTYDKLDLSRLHPTF